MAGKKIINYGYGDLNPVLASRTKHPSIDKDEGFFDVLKRTAEVVHTPDNLKGISELRGVVLRVEQDIVNNSDIPANSWLSGHYSHGKKRLEQPLQAYKIYIPELHAHLPRVGAYAPRRWTKSKQHKNINRYPTFIAANSGVEKASEGQIVRVSFANMETQEGPIYLGPVFNKPVGPIDDGESTSSKGTFDKNEPINSSQPPTEGI